MQTAHQHTSTPAHQKQKAVISTLLMLLLVLPFLCAQEEPWDSTDVTLEFPEDSIFFADVCMPLAKVTAIHVINFETVSKLFLKIENPDGLLLNNNLIVKRTQHEDSFLLPVEIVNGYYSADIEPDEEYEILGKNTCDEFYIIGIASAVALPENAMIEVREDLWEALRHWKHGGGAANLFDFFDGLSNISIVEKVAFLQNFIGGGLRIPDQYIEQPHLLNTAIQALSEIRFGGDDEPGRQDCYCRALNLRYFRSETARLRPNFHHL
jgi:hypothetical protein